MSNVENLGISEEALGRICSRYGVRELSPFGSAARGELRPDSDIDLLVVFDERVRVGLLLLGRLQQELAKAFGRSVDLVPRDGLKPALKARVLGEARTRYAA